MPRSDPFSAEKKLLLVGNANVDDQKCEVKNTFIIKSSRI